MPGTEAAQSGLIYSPPGVTPAYVEAWKNVLHLGAGLDDSRLLAEFGNLSGASSEALSTDQTAAVEAYADVREVGESEAVTLRVNAPTREHIRQQFEQHRPELSGREFEIVVLRLRRIARS